MMSAGLRDREAGVTERYCPDAASRKAWELCMSRPRASRAREAFLFFLNFRESSSQSSATVIITIKPPVEVLLH